jgi:septal ring factor EnvC (AmiA/AmiB activator)
MTPEEYQKYQKLKKEVSVRDAHVESLELEVKSLKEQLKRANKIIDSLSESETKLKQQLEKEREFNSGIIDHLEESKEYWNQDRNDMAMYDALMNYESVIDDWIEKFRVKCLTQNQSKDE